MKLSLKSIGTAELGDQDLGAALRMWANESKTNSSMLTKIITDYLVRAKNMKVLKLQKSPTHDKIVVGVEFEQDEGATMIGQAPKEKIVRSTNEGFTKNFRGFYKSVRAIIDEQKAKGKSVINLDDLYALLLKETDAKGNKLFVRGGVPMEKTRFVQYLSPSQLDPKKVPSMKGVKHDKNGNITF